MSDAAIASSSGGFGTGARAVWDVVLPVVVVVAVIIGAWYVACVPMNIKEALTQAERAGAVVEPAGAKERRDMSAVGLALANSAYARDTLNQERPRLPAPHQVGQELWNTTGGMVLNGKAFSKRSLIYHGWVTLSATVLGFAIGTVAGVGLAIGIVHSRVMNMAVMPWAIASQTIPILAIAPMIIVVLNSIGVTGLLPKALISAYLSFFPVAVGMVKGLRSPDNMQLDLLSTYSASQSETFWKLRLPSSMPYFFTSMKIGMAASLVGAIVGELPTGAVRGLGARLLAGSYYGQTVQIWAALFAAAILAAVLVGVIGLLQRMTLKKMGMVH
ncbi:ABC transporter permease [Aliiruegeria lutimaris]|uniref:NitT/TauT family transport system permease protein n=1 Tax=Aliiruegeria lutimaris TaxID=571298 RepID=A0A1G8IQX8_9RHOB|nr:ABC transporter permease [Aliiruegeria lutimaris]SDI21263.1 NitT/TauT family transport system permease protein [Aliiruegeria lutimaris]